MKKCFFCNLLIFNWRGKVNAYVGYRVHSQQGTAFRIWATGVLREYLLKGVAIRQRFSQLEERVDRRLLSQHNEIQQIRERQYEQQKQLDFFIRTNTLPAEMVFFEGDFYTARVALENLVRMATKRAILVDAYVNALTLDILDVRSQGVQAVICTAGVGPGMQRLMQEHDRLFPKRVRISTFASGAMSRITGGSSLMTGSTIVGIRSMPMGGHKISAVTLMGTSPEVILTEMA